MLGVVVVFEAVADDSGGTLVNFTLLERSKAVDNRAEHAGNEQKQTQQEHEAIHTLSTKLFPDLESQKHYKHNERTDHTPVNGGVALDQKKVG